MKKNILTKLILIAIILFMASELKATIYPEPLKEGDKVAILAPAGPVRRDRVDATVEVLRGMGYEPVVYPTAYMNHGQLSAPADRRLQDLKKALLDPEIRAVICARGGYGIVHLLDSLETLPIRENPKWVVGFSDISALHAFMASKGVASIHGGMALQIARGADEPENTRLFEILRDTFPTYSFSPDRRNHPGHAEGKLLGGNLSVIQALIGTPYDIIQPGTILFIEDVSEPIYKVERMMYQLKLSGILEKINGLIIGQFTNYRADKENAGYSGMEEMLVSLLKDYPHLPVVFNAPIGHVRHNIPMIESADAILDVSRDSVTLRLTR